MSSDQHHARYGRTRRGTQTWGNLRGAAGMHYATTVRCSCGWNKQVNQAPSKGGRKFAEELHAAHVAEDAAAATP